MSAEHVQAATRHWVGLGPGERARVGPDLIGVCADALRELTTRLGALAYPVDPMLVPCARPDDVIAELEQVGPAVPPALAEVWRRIGEIRLVDLGGYRHLAFWEERLGGDGRVFACDGVVVEGACGDEGWIGYLVDHLEELIESGEEPAYPIAPDHLHKDNTSGGGP